MKLWRWLVRVWTDDRIWYDAREAEAYQRAYDAGITRTGVHLR